MKIGIVGAGEMGGTLIRQYSRAGHSVKMANAYGTGKLKNLALEIGASAVTLADVVADVDAIVISIPLIGILKLPQTLFKNACFKNAAANIDTSNYYPVRDGIIKDIES